MAARSRPLAILWLALTLAAATSPARASDAGKGIRDLRAWDFRADGLADLGGQWSICWDALLTPDRPDCPGGWKAVPMPGLWSEPDIAASRAAGTGFATYRLRILLPEDAPPLSLRSGATFTAHRLWIDGRPYRGSGRVGRTVGESTAQTHNRVHVIPERALEDGDLDLLVQISNHEFRGGGMRRLWLLGTRDQIRTWVVLDTLAYGVFGAISLLVGLIYLTQFALRPRERVRGYFGLAALAVGIRVLAASPSDVRQLLFPGMSFPLALRIEYLTTSLMIVAGSGYFGAKLRDVIPSWLTRSIQAGGAATGAMSAFAPLPAVLATLRPIEILALLAMVTGFGGYAAALWRGRRHLRWNFVALCLFAVAVVHDIVRVETGFGAPLELFSFFMLVWLVSEAWEMSRSFADSYSTIESLSRELKDSNEELRQTNAAVMRFVPFEFIDRLDRRSIREVGPGDHVETDMNVMFCDIRGFTGLVEGMDAKEAFDLVNDYLGRMEPVIHAHDGFVNQYLGDCIMALFPREGDRAIRAGIEMSAVARAMNRSRGGNPRGEGDFRIGIGLNAGSLMLGTIGGDERLSGGVIGDAVNIASRVEALTKVYGTVFAVTDRTLRSVSDPSPFSLRELDRVVVRGRRERIGVFEVLDALDGETRNARLANLDRFAEARALFAAGALDRAREEFETCLVRDVTDRSSALYIDRIRRAGVADRPGPDDAPGRHH